MSSVKPEKRACSAEIGSEIRSEPAPPRLDSGQPCTFFLKKKVNQAPRVSFADPQRPDSRFPSSITGGELYSPTRNHTAWAVFGFKNPNSKFFFRYLHGDLNLDEIKNALRLLSVNGETNLMNLIRL